MNSHRLPADPSLIDSRLAAERLLVSLCIATLGNAAMYVLPVVLTLVQGEFGITRSNASLPYTATMIGFGIGGVWCGRWADRGIAVAVCASGNFLAGTAFGMLGALQRLSIPVGSNRRGSEGDFR